ncbi:MAG: hypothetical protein ACPLQO_12810 [Desulfotomaculales bacterium]
MTDGSLREKVEDWLRTREQTAVIGFRTSAVRKTMPGSTEKEIEHILMSLVAEGRLKVEWDIMCPECFSTVRTVQSLDSISPDEEYCWHCGRDVHVDADTAIPVFYFAQKYQPD